MEYKNINIEIIKTSFNDLNYNKPSQERKVKLYTGIGGFDLTVAATEDLNGYCRVYIGKKVPRFIRVVKSLVIKKSVLGEYYRLVKK